MPASCHPLHYIANPAPHTSLPGNMRLVDLYDLQCKGWHGAFALPEWKEENKKCTFSLERIDPPTILNGVYQYRVVKAAKQSSNGYNTFNKPAEWPLLSATNDKTVEKLIFDKSH